MSYHAGARDARDFDDADTSSALGRAASRLADGFAGLVAIGLAGAVIGNIFFMQETTLRTADRGATTVAVGSKPRPAPVAGPGTPAMIFAPATASSVPAASAKLPAPAAPPASSAPPVQSAALPPEAVVPPAALPVPKAPSPVVADIQRELARRGFYDGTVDGLSGPRTEAAVRAFEQAARLRVSSGEPNEAVLGELRRSTVAAAPRPVAPAAAAAPALSPAAAAAQAMLPPAGLPSDATGSVRPPGGLPAGSSRILAVQKSLARLGYGPIKLDGQPGSETRLAIQRFERDRNLPTTGEIDDRLLRELSAVSGMPVE